MSVHCLNGPARETMSRESARLARRDENLMSPETLSSQPPQPIHVEDTFLRLDIVGCDIYP